MINKMNVKQASERKQKFRFISESLSVLAFGEIRSMTVVAFATVLMMMTRKLQFSWD